MDRAAISRFAVGFVLAAVGTSLFFMKKADVTTHAQNPPTTYTTKWDATQILTAFGIVGTSGTGPAGLGVWGWRVEGKVGTTEFTENWSAPSITNISFSPASQGCGVNGVNTSLIMAGCFGDQDNIGGDDTTSYNFELKGINSYEGLKSRLNVGGAGKQRTISCIDSPRNPTETECIIQTGAYSFLHIYEPGFETRDRILGGGTLMPLHWDVSGTITQPGTPTP